MIQLSQYSVTTNNPEQTIDLGNKLGQNLIGGEVIVLVSDLGGGKTTLIKGLAAGMGSKDLVSSPSFTLTNEYKSKRLSLYHLDLYRLSEPGIIGTELKELMGESRSVVVIEWPGIIEDILPAEHLTIKISVKDEDSRIFEFSYPNKYNYLIPKN